VQDDLNAALGGNLNPALETPQGQIATTETAIISDQNDLFLLLTQNVDPAYSTGRMQDGIARIYFLSRYPALPTVVNATCIGLVDVTIPIGAQAKALDGNIYTATATGKIAHDGTVVLPFACSVTGPIACTAGQLNQVNTVIPGWDAITNLASGVLGQDVETPTQFERRRFNSVAGNSAGMLASVQGAVLGVPDVTDAYTTENFTDAPDVRGDITLKPHSLYVCVAGAASSDAIARAIFTKKAPGCDMTGNIGPIMVADNNAGYAYPPSYPITYQNALAQTFVFTVTLLNSTSVPADAATQIQTAIMAAWSGADGGSRARIGSVVFASRYYGPVSQLGLWAQIMSIKLGSDVAPASSFNGSIATNLLTVTGVPTHPLAVNQTITGLNVPSGTRIVSFGTGTGGAGTYNLNTAVDGLHPILSEPMLALLPTLDDVAVGIAHVPVLAAVDINVVLAATP
jgi:hypothetical protein